MIKIKARFFYCLFFLLLFWQISFAQSDLAFKSAYISRFVQNINWPEGIIGSEFVLGIIGDKSVSDELNAMMGSQYAKNKRIKVKLFSTVEEIETCPIVFISNTGKLFISSIFRKIEGKSILIITEREGSLEKGSGVNFINVGGKINYEINKKQLEKAGLKVQNKIYEGAYRVYPEEKGSELSANNKKNPDLETIKRLDKSRNDLEKAKMDIEAEKERIAKLQLSPAERDSLLKAINNIEAEKNVEELKSQQIEAQRKQLESQAAREKAEKEAALQENKAVTANQRFQLSVLLGTITLISSLTILFYSLNRKRKKIIDDLEIARHELSEKIEEIHQQKEMIEQSAEMMVEQNLKITDSIRYALTIQQAMLPGDTKLATCFPEFFIIYTPKDIVSGDFYWVSKIDNLIFVAVVDCTGHGVPGAFMSNIGIDLLNEIITERRTFDPAQVLEMLHLGIFERLRQSDSKNRDGMDVCLCMIENTDKDKLKVVFAGAKRPLYYIQKGEFKKVQGDSKYIGGILKEKQAFKNHELLLQKDDLLYLTTDGYVDTPDPQRRKFGSQKFQDLLSSFSNKNLSEQKEILISELANHQKEAQARDDTTVLGIRL